MTYKGFLLASAGGLAAASGSAQAADLPVKAAMAAPVAVNWTGWYAGLHAGGAWQSIERVSTRDGLSGDFNVGLELPWRRPNWLQLAAWKFRVRRRSRHFGTELRRPAHRRQGRGWMP